MTDREIIIAAAERVMGWRISYGGDQKQRVYARDSKARSRVIADDEGTLPRVLVHWNPLESIADAWMLVEALRSRPDAWSFRYGNNACCHDQHAASFARGYRGLGSNILTGEYIEADMAPVVASTAPRAITLAALCAVGVEGAARG